MSKTKARSSRKAATTAPTLPIVQPMPQVGDRVIPEGSKNTFVVTSVRSGGSYVDISLPGTNLSRFNVDVGTLKFVDRVAGKPAAPARDTEAIVERVEAIRRENLERFDDDVAVLTRYLKGESAPKATIDAMEALRSEVHESWQAALGRITDLLEE
jgi:hypothetical protein